MQVALLFSALALCGAAPYDQTPTIYDIHHALPTSYSDVDLTYQHTAHYQDVPVPLPGYAEISLNAEHQGNGYLVNGGDKIPHLGNPVTAKRPYSLINQENGALFRPFNEHQAPITMQNQALYKGISSNPVLHLNAVPNFVVAQT